MRRNAGRTRLARCAKTASRLAPPHSMPASGTCAEKDMSEAAVSTPELGEESDQARVGALVVDQEAAVDAVRDAVLGDVDGVGMAAEMVAGLEQRDVGVARQAARRGEAGDAGADDRDAPHRRASPRSEAARPSGRARCKKNVAERPRGNEGGRREEENPPGISAGRAGRLRDGNRFVVPARRAAPSAGRDGPPPARRAGMTRSARRSSANGGNSSMAAGSVFSVTIGCTQPRAGRMP